MNGAQSVNDQKLPLDFDALGKEEPELPVFDGTIQC